MVRPKVIGLFRKYYPNYQGEEGVFRRHLNAASADARDILEVGCGSGGLCNHDLRGPRRTVIGVDPDQAVAGNPWVDHSVIGSATALPMPEGSVDLVVTRYVLEHLEDPEGAFAEIARVLRSGGRWVLITPNSFHYVTMLARVTPTWFHRWIKVGHSVKAEDVYPTYYRANSVRAISGHARAAGLRVASLDRFESSPNYLEFSRVFYRLGVAYERVVNRVEGLAGLRTCIVATLVKPTSASLGMVP